MPPQAPADIGAALGGLAAAIRAGRSFPWWYPEAAKRKAIDYFVYGTDYLPLAASATATQTINISGDSAFVILSAVIIESTTGNTTFFAIPPILFNIKDTGSGRDLSNRPVHASNWFGTAEEPKYWDIPKIIAPNSSLSIAAQNLEAVDRNVRVDFHGFKIFDFTAG